MEQLVDKAGLSGDENDLKLAASHVSSVVYFDWLIGVYDPLDVSHAVGYRPFYASCSARSRLSRKKSVTPVNNRFTSFSSGTGQL